MPPRTMNPVLLPNMRPGQSPLGHCRHLTPLRDAKTCRTNPTRSPGTTGDVSAVSVREPQKHPENTLILRSTDADGREACAAFLFAATSPMP